MESCHASLSWPLTTRPARQVLFAGAAGVQGGRCGVVGLHDPSPVTARPRTVFFINLRHKHWVLIVFGSLARQRRGGMVVVMIRYKFMIQELLIRSLSIRRHACHHLFLFSLLSTRVLVACVDTLRQITSAFYFPAQGYCWGAAPNGTPHLFLRKTSVETLQN